MGASYRVDEIGKILNVSPNTVRRWIHQKRIGSIKLSERSYRITQEQLDRFLSSRIMPEETASKGLGDEQGG